MADLAAQLARSGVLSAEALGRSLAAANDGDVVSAALRLGLVEEGALARALADFHEGPAVDLSCSVVPTQNLVVVPAGYCRQRRVLPIVVGRSEMVLAMAEPEDRALADELRLVTGRTVLRYAAVHAAMERAIDGLVREKSRGGRAWRGPRAPALPDPGAAWVGVVHGSGKIEPAMDLPGLEQAALRPFDAPTPARRERSREKVAPAPPRQDGASTTVRLEGAGAGKLALVAEPTAEGREEIAALIGRLGCTVLQAANGRAALDIAREARPDLVVLEALMPMMPGFEVCRAIKGDPVLRPTQVVLTSAVHSGAVAADAGVVFGADASLERPYRPEEVLRTVKVMLVGPAAEASDPAARAAAAQACRKGEALLRERRLEEAVEVLRQATARDDLSAEAHHQLGLALAQLGLLFEATAELARAAELRPDVDAAHRSCALAYEALGFRKTAREAWARAIETCTDEVRKRAMQGRLTTLLGL